MIRDYLDSIKAILEVFQGTDANEIEISIDHVRIKVSRESRSSRPPRLSKQVTLTAPQSGTFETKIESSPNGDDHRIVVEAAMFGIFYDAPSPDMPPFVTIGSHITKGQQLCAIEAMKVFNSILAPVDGRIEEIHVDNGQDVEAGQSLYTIVPEIK